MARREKCIVCEGDFFPDHSFVLEGMPKGAQQYDDPDKVDLEVVQCRYCGLVQITNEPVDYYKDVIRAAAFSEEMRHFRMQQFSKFIQDNNLQGKKVLEAGCGGGEYLQLMKDCGADAYGIEHNDELVDACISQGLNVRKGYVDEGNVEIGGPPFDAFISMNFLEHYINPVGMLESMFANLSYGGVGLVEVPNFDMMIKTDHFSEFIGDHISYFRKSNLTDVLNKAGFIVEDCSVVWNDYIISAKVRKGEKVNLIEHTQFPPLDDNHECKVNFRPMRFKKDKVLSSLNQYVDKYGENNVAVYGAGHQALAVIAMSGIGDRLKYIVDDATFKQGRRAPASDVIIKHPSSLSSDPVQAIIVMGASYSDEIIDKLKKSNYNNLDIAVLRQEGLKVYL